MLRKGPQRKGEVGKDEVEEESLVQGKSPTICRTRERESE